MSSDAIREAKLQQAHEVELANKIKEEQAEKLARLKQRIKEANEKNPDRTFVEFKIRSLKEHLVELDEALHYAKQDLAAFEEKMDISGNTSRAREAVEAVEKEIYETRQEIARLERE